MQISRILMPLMGLVFVAGCSSSGGGDTPATPAEGAAAIASATVTPASLTSGGGQVAVTANYGTGTLPGSVSAKASATGKTDVTGTLTKTGTTTYTANLTLPGNGGITGISWTVTVSGGGTATAGTVTVPASAPPAPPGP